MKLRLSPRTVRYTVQPAIGWLARTWRMVPRQAEHWRAVNGAGAPFIIMCWHEALLPVIWQHRGHGIAALVSAARDGEYLAGFAASAGYRLVRGSSTRGAAQALRSAWRTLQDGVPVGITPDGPRGPARVMKPGAVILAERTGAPILPVHAQAGRSWRLSTWDGLIVPKPFATVEVSYGPPIRVGRGASGRRAAVEHATRALAELTGAPWHDVATSIG